MPITPEQLESIKAANHAASRAWEAATFLEGDVVLSHGHKVRRSGSHWICLNTSTEYTTLSRYFRHKLNRKTFNVKWNTSLMVGSIPVPMIRVPPPAERVNYSPWTQGRPYYLPSQSVGGIRSEILSDPYLAPVAPAPEQQDTGNKNAIATLKSKLDSLMTRIAASELRISLLAEKERILTKQQNGLAALLNTVAEREQRLNAAIAASEEQQNRINALEERLIAASEEQQNRINTLEERLIAVGVVAAHTVLFKQRIETLEALAERPH
jgi:hypothetical protein